jgi:hypothetical protein
MAQSIWAALRFLIDIRHEQSQLKWTHAALSFPGAAEMFKLNTHTGTPRNADTIYLFLCQLNFLCGLHVAVMSCKWFAYLSTPGMWNHILGLEG